MQPYEPAAFTPRKYSWYSFQLEVQSIPGSQCGRIMSVTTQGIEPASFRLVAQSVMVTSIDMLGKRKTVEYRSSCLTATDRKFADLSGCFLIQIILNMKNKIKIKNNFKQQEL